METIRSKDNQIVKDAVKLASDRRFRRASGRFMTEGLRLCYDAAVSGTAIDTALVTEAALHREKDSERLHFLLSHTCRSFVITEEISAKISETISPQGVFCICSGVDKSDSLDTIETGGKYLALERIQDPQNMGTVLRTAEALGLDGIILSEDCCDVFSPKVLRGSMGAVFRVKLFHVSDFPSAMLQLREAGLRIFASTPSEDAVSLRDCDFRAGGCVICVGNEADGLSSETLATVNNRITIPMGGGAESLNAAAAAAILIWEMIR